MAPNLAIATTGLLLVVSALPLGIAQTPGTEFVVPFGSTVVVDADIRADRITVAGVLLRNAPGDLVMEAASVTLLSTAVVKVANGARAVAVAAQDAHGADGQDGGSIRIAASRIDVAAGAVLAAGNGGAGASTLAAVPPSRGLAGTAGTSCFPLRT
jgi:hypothetical protein